MRGLSNKRAIVTGGAQGIGRACVEAFLSYGCSVVISDIDEETGNATTQSLREQGGKVFFIQGDMQDEAFCEAQVQFAVEKMGGLDFLINNAFSFVAAGLQANRAEWIRSMTVGPMGFAKMIQEVSGPMQAAGGGAIVNISSISGHIAQPGRWTYNAAKGAVGQITRCAALDLAPMGIRVNAVSPGWIWTREVLKAADYDQAKYEPIWGNYHMMRRCGRPEEVASACMFLCSDEASFITGTDLPVDGGYLGLGGEGIGADAEYAGSL
ncbi:SDR family oxidoreductase [Pontibacter sp. G13]|uniref:SDR family oxidoreductase n=1 Tax=Pontibacter sp. G13 TaxID=3074898 RepID=UPI00288A52F7|nr:SDR family oxidoreductase [Pontibacter sp. G13]WNJ18449.1 SDR family oxidoreductase [Pontibacter sp. G13]